MTKSKLNFLQKIGLSYYFLLPYFGYVSILYLYETKILERGIFSGIIILLGWLALLVYQIFIVAINQTPLSPSLKKRTPLFKGTYPLVVPLIMLIKQYFVGTSWSVFFIEVMVLEVAALLFALYVSMIFIEKKLLTFVNPAGLMFFAISIAMTWCLFLLWGLEESQNIVSFGLYLSAGLFSVVQHVLFFKERYIKKIPLKDFKFFGYEIPVIIGQIIIWIFVIPLIFEIFFR